MDDSKHANGWKYLCLRVILNHLEGCFSSSGRRSQLMGFSCKLYQDCALIVSVAGCYDNVLGASIEKSEELASGTLPAIIDLSAVTFMDSSGLGELVKIIRRFKQTDRKIVLLSPSPFIEKTLQMTRLDKVVPVIHNLDQALEQTLNS